MGGDDDATFLMASGARLDLLDRLREAPASPRDLVEATDVSRASVQRNLAAFVERGWVHRDAGTYHATAAGRAVARAAERFLDGVAGANRAAPVLSRLPQFDPPLEPAWLAEAAVAVADEERPHAPVERYLAWLDGLDDADRIVGMSPVVSGVFDSGHADLIEAGVETELVIERSLARRVRTEDLEGFARSLSYDRFELYLTDDPVRFGLAICDGETFLGGYDDQGRMRACCIAAAPDLDDWATERYRSRRAAATRVEAPGDVPTGDPSSPRSDPESGPRSGAESGPGPG